MDETVTYEDVVDEVCASDGSEELCRVVFEEEFRAADGDGDGRLSVMEWTDLVWAEGLTDKRREGAVVVRRGRSGFHRIRCEKRGHRRRTRPIAPASSSSTPPPTELSAIGRERRRRRVKKMQEARRKQRGK